MPIEPIKIPQNVHIEDRIVGPLTLKQVLICAVGGGFSYALFASISKTYGSIALPLQILVWVPAAVSALFAFVRINDLSMMRLCLLFLERMNKSPTRVWTPRRGIIINVRTFHTVAENNNHSKMSAFVDKKTEKFDEISTMLDQKLPEEKAPELSQMADEPLEDDVPVTQQNPNIIRTPVNPMRITASPITPNAVDTVAPKSGSVSIFRDISPATHA